MIVDAKADNCALPTRIFRRRLWFLLRDGLEQIIRRDFNGVWLFQESQLQERVNPSPLSADLHRDWYNTVDGTVGAIYVCVFDSTCRNLVLDQGLHGEETGKKGGGEIEKKKDRKGKDRKGKERKRDELRKRKGVRGYDQQ